MANVLIIAFSKIARDPRVRRQLRALGNYHEITAVGLGPFNDFGVEYIEIPRCKTRQKSLPRRILDGMVRRLRLLLTSGDSYFWYVLQHKFEMTKIIPLLSRRKFDLVIANDIDSLPFVFRVGGHSPVLVDAHEYAPGQFDHRLGWRIFVRPRVEDVCRKYFPRCAYHITVNEGCVELYNRRFGVEFDVVTNATEYVELSPSPVQADDIRLVHHGGAMRSRRIEKMIQMMDYLPPKYSLDLILVSADRGYVDELRSMAAQRQRVRVLQPLPPDQIPQHLNKYDIGVYIMEGSSTNNRIASPNKLYEFVQARICLAVSPSQEMKKLVDRWDVGVVSPDFSPEAMAKTIEQLTVEQIRIFKQRSDEVAYALSGQPNLDKLRRIAERLTRVSA